MYWLMAVARFNTKNIAPNGWVYVLYALPNLSIKVRHLIRRIAYIPC